MCPQHHTGDVTRPLAHVDCLCAQEDLELSSRITHRDRVTALANTDPGLLVDAVLRTGADVEGLLGEHAELSFFDGEALADGDGAPEDVPGVISLVASGAELV